MTDTVQPTSPLKKVLGNAGQLLSGRVVNAVVGLAYIALTARSLGKEAMGVVVLINAFAQFLGEVAHFQSWQTLITYGTAPAMDPNPNGVQFAVGPGDEVVSISHPNRIMDTFTPNSATSAAMSVMPVIPAMSTIINDADRLYSTQRNRFRRAASSRRYRGNPQGEATSAWNAADSRENAAIAGPSR